MISSNEIPFIYLDHNENIVVRQMKVDQDVSNLDDFYALTDTERYLSYIIELVHILLRNLLARLKGGKYSKH